MGNKPQYACPECGETEFTASLNSYDKFQAIGNKLCWQSTECANEEFHLYCRECGERAPHTFEDAVQ